MLHTVLLSLWLSVACDAPKPPPAEQPRAPDKAASGKSTSATGGASGAGKSTTTERPTAERPTDDSAAGPLPAPYRTSNRALMQWKRYSALEADLMGALQLSKEQLCSEIGGKSCIQDVHLVPLGGNEPYLSGLMKPSSEPLATTSSVVDRVLLSACSTRARLDREGEPRVFTALDLRAPLPSADHPTIATTIVELYRRLLARDPEPNELARVAELASPGDEPLSTSEFAALACFTIGSTTEFLFF